MGIEIVETVDERENYEGILDPVVQATATQEGKPDGKPSQPITTE